MNRLYTKTNRIRFTSISEKYRVDKSFKGKISELHSSLITYVCNHFRDTKKYKQQVVDVLNIMTYAVYSGDILTSEWKLTSPLENIPQIEDGLIEATLGDIFLTVEAIDWDIQPAYDSTSVSTSTSVKQDVTMFDPAVVRKTVPKVVKKVQKLGTTFSINPTPKQDLYVQSPVVPRFDYSKIWMSGREGSDELILYTTLPEIPTRQNEISCTTDVTQMTYAELVNLYPNVVIHTRAPVLYEHIEGLDYEDDIGVILPIEDYTREQLVDNIIQYPHFFRLVREVGDSFVSFYTHIEIDGQLKSILDVWEDLPDTRKIPRHKDFIKEYVVRKYLLDSTYKNIKFQYPLFGSLDPFLTLFMPSDNYIRRGYTDIESIARRCVLSRVKYKISRNPIIRRLENA